MSLEKAIQKLAKAIQSPNLNMAPEVDLELPRTVLNVKCYTKGIRLQEGGPIIQHCICRAKNYQDGCIIKMTQGFCDPNQKQYKITIPPESYPSCIPTPPGLGG